MPALGDLGMVGGGLGLSLDLGGEGFDGGEWREWRWWVHILWWHSLLVLAQAKIGVLLL